MHCVSAPISPNFHVRVPILLAPSLDRLSHPHVYSFRCCYVFLTQPYSAASGLYKTKDEEAAGDMMRHTPLLATTLNDLVKGKMSASAFPVVGGWSVGKQDPAGSSLSCSPRHSYTSCVLSRVPH